MVFKANVCHLLSLTFFVTPEFQFLCTSVQDIPVLPCLTALSTYIEGNDVYYPTILGFTRPILKSWEYLRDLRFCARLTDFSKQHIRQRMNYYTVQFSVQYIKGVIYDSDPIHFLSNSENISSRSTSFPFCVCAEKKAGVHIQPWLCKRETDRVARVESPTQDVKYRRFSHVSTKHFSITCHNSCLYTGPTDAVCYSRKFEGELKRQVYLFGCWVQISTSLLQNHRPNL